MSCVTFQQAISTLQLLACHAYGVSASCYVDIGCTDIWDVEKRCWFVQKLAAAESMIERDIGAPLCPTQIYSESQPLSPTIYTRQKPIAYLGMRVETFIDDFAITYDNTPPASYPLPPFSDCTADGWKGYVVLTDADLPIGVTASDVIFKYPEENCSDCGQELQEPCYRRVYDEDLEEYVHVWMWSKCQLLRPELDTAPITQDPPTSFLLEVAAYYHHIDASQAVVLPPGCGCDISDGSLTVEIGDAYAGEVCLTGSCEFSGHRFYLNYGTAFRPDQDRVSPDLVQAVVLLALTLMGSKKLCGCEHFDQTVAYWLETDPDSRVAMVVPAMVRYGGTRAGMQAMRIIDRVLVRPHFNEPVKTSGVMTAGRMRGIPRQ